VIETERQSCGSHRDNKDTDWELRGREKKKETRMRQKRTKRHEDIDRKYSETKTEKERPETKTS
jgi:hypothetical protein